MNDKLGELTSSISPPFFLLMLLLLLLIPLLHLAHPLYIYGFFSVGFGSMYKLTLDVHSTENYCKLLLAR